MGGEFGAPGHGLGRPMKVGKEEIVGALTALCLYPKRDHLAELNAQKASLDVLRRELTGPRGFSLTAGHAQTPGYFLSIQINAAEAGFDAAHLTPSG